MSRKSHEQDGGSSTRLQRRRTQCKPAEMRREHLAVRHLDHRGLATLDHHALLASKRARDLR